MPVVLLATESGCRVFTESGNETLELPGRRIGPLELEAVDTCLAIVDEREVWRRAADGKWSSIAELNIAVQSVVCGAHAIFCGAMDEAAIVRISPDGTMERLASFDHVAGRNEWFAGGPPLGVRSLAVTSGTTFDGQVLLAGVHVGGIPRSDDGGATWTPTVPVMFDVHQVQAHPSLPNVIVAAAAVGVCVGRDQGKTWTVFSDGLPLIYSLACAVLDGEILFSIQNGPFAKRSQIWRWRLADEKLEQVHTGLPEWLDGRVDTNGLVTNHGRAAIADCGGNLWLSDSGSIGWKRIATDIPYAWGLAII